MLQKPISFIDLDDCSFHSKRKCQNPVYPATVNRQGTYHCFMDERQHAMYQWLKTTTRMIPATNRGVTAFGRCLLTFDSHAIVSGGGIILNPPDSTGVRKPNKAWLETISSLAEPYVKELDRIISVAESACQTLGIDARVDRIEDHGIGFYLELKHLQKDVQDLNKLLPVLESEYARPDGWRLNNNDNNITVMPPFFSKGQAVKWFLENLAGSPPFIFGMGDSLSDIEFLSQCDYAATPTRQSQVFNFLSN